MKGHEKEVEWIEKLAAEIDRNPLTKKFREEEAVATLVTRTAAADRIEVLKHEAESSSVIQAEIDIMVEKVAALDRERGMLVSEISGKRAVLERFKLDIEGEIRQQEEMLLSTCDLKIDEAITWFRERREALLRKKVDSQTHKTGTNIFTMVKTFVTFSNRNAITNALTYCLAAIRELESMKLTPTLDTSRIETLKKGIPDIGKMEEITGERPFSPIYTNPPMKSDSQDEEVGLWEKQAGGRL